MLECRHDGLVGLPEHRCIHREVNLARTALIWEQEYPVPTQGGQKCLDVNTRVEFDGEDVRAMRKAPYPDAIALVETVNEGSAFSHGGAKAFHESLDALQGERRCKTRRCEPTAEHAPLVVEVSEARPCPCQYSPERRPEILVEGDVHCIEVGSVLLRANAGRSRHHI